MDAQSRRERAGAFDWDLFEAEGYEQRIVSPKGGKSPLEPRALKWPLLDRSAKAWLNDPARMALLSETA